MLRPPLQRREEKKVGWEGWAAKGSTGLRQITVVTSQVWSILVLLLLASSVSTCLQHSHNLGLAI